jgi:hypothetical protein
MSRDDAAVMIVALLAASAWIAVVIYINVKRMKNSHNLSGYDIYQFMLRLGDFRSLQIGSTEFVQKIAILLEIFIGTAFIWTVIILIARLI